MNIKRQYIIDESNHKVAVQIDIETFEKIEEALENYALFSLMNETNDGDDLNLAEAKNYLCRTGKGIMEIKFNKNF